MRQQEEQPQAGVEGICWQPVEKGVSGETEIGNVARNIQPSAAVPAMLGRTGIPNKQEMSRAARWQQCPMKFGEKTRGWYQG